MGAGPAAAMGIGKWVRKLLSEGQAKEHARATGGAVRRATTVAAEANRCGAARKHRSLSPSADASSRPAMPWVCGSLYASLARPAMTSNRTASAREHLWSAA